MSAASLADLERVAADLERRIGPDNPAVAKVLRHLGSSKSAINDNSSLPLLDVLLHYLPADAGRGSGKILEPDGRPSEDCWLGIMLALHAAYGEAAEGPLRQWSKTSDRYDDKGFDAAWQAFNPDHPDPIGIGSVLMLAKARGWDSRAHSQPAAVASSGRYELLTSASVLELQPPVWRVKGLLPESGIAAVFGPSGSGKSFLALDMLITIAEGRPWYGRRTSSCDVTYVMLEGELGLRNRLAAWQHRHQRPIPETFRAIIQPFNLGLEQDVADLCAALPEGGVVVIDTLNRAGPGLDENSSKDMGLIIAALKTIARKTGGLVIVVHHTGKDASKGMRGHSALNAALDAAIEVKSVDLRRCWTSAKVKDGPDDGIEPFRLETIPLGLDADGDPITSCVAIYDQNTPPIVQFRQPSGSQQRIVLDAIRVAIAEPADSDRATANGEASRIRFEDAISAAAMNLTSVAPAKRNHNARQLVEKLINRGFLQSAADRQGANWISISPRSS